MPRFKLTIEYAGTRYSGWQIQKNARTIQGEIDGAVRTITGRKDFELYGSGRTDAGVHALAQVAHLDVSTNLPPETLAPAAERRAAGRHQHPRGERSAAPVSRASRRGRAPISVSDCPPPYRFRQGVRLVGQEPMDVATHARGRPRASRACAISSRSPSSTTRDEAGEAGALNARARRSARLRRGRRPRARRRRRFALSLEDGAEDGGRARGNRPRRTGAGRRRAISRRCVRCAGAADGAAVRALPRSRVLRERHPRRLLRAATP